MVYVWYSPQERAELICLEQWEAVEDIDQQLEALGTEKLTSAEVAERFGSTEGISPCVSVPTNTNVTWWLSEQAELRYNGVTYVVQQLIAQPNEQASNLKMEGDLVLRSTYGWRAGAMNALEVVGKSAAGIIPGAAVALTVYDVASAFASGLSSTTEITNASISYTYAHTTTVSFIYVKVKGESDNSQYLSYISSTGTTAVGYQFSSFSYTGGTVTPSVIQGSRTITSTPTGYNSANNAVAAYANSRSIGRAFVTEVTITGIESNVVGNIYPVCPEFPGNIY